MKTHGAGAEAARRLRTARGIGWRMVRWAPLGLLVASVVTVAGQEPRAASDYRVVVRVGDAVDGIPVATLGMPLSGDGTTAATSATTEGILISDGPHAVVAVRTGDPTPTEVGGRFITFGGAWFNDSGSLLFWASYDSPTSTQSPSGSFPSGLFLRFPSGDIVSVWTQDPRCGVSFSPFTLTGLVQLAPTGDVFYASEAYNSTTGGCETVISQWSVQSGETTQIGGPLDGILPASLQTGEDGSVGWIVSGPRGAAFAWPPSSPAAGNLAVPVVPAGMLALDGFAVGPLRAIALRNRDELVVSSDIDGSVFRWRADTAGLERLVHAGDHVDGAPIDSLGGALQVASDGTVSVAAVVAGKHRLLRILADRMVLASQEEHVATPRFGGKIVRDGHVLFAPFATRSSMGFGAYVAGGALGGSLTPKFAASRAGLAVVVSKSLLLEYDESNGARIAAAAGYLPHAGRLARIGGGFVSVFGGVVNAIGGADVTTFVGGLPDGRVGLFRGARGRWSRVLVYGRRSRPSGTGDAGTGDQGGRRNGRSHYRTYGLLNADEHESILIATSVAGTSAKKRWIILKGRGAGERFSWPPTGIPQYLDPSRARVYLGRLYLQEGSTLYLGAAGHLVPILQEGSPVPDGSQDVVASVDTFEADAHRLAVAITTTSNSRRVLLQQDGGDWQTLDQADLNLASIRSVILANSALLVDGYPEVDVVTSGERRVLIHSGDEGPLGPLNSWSSVTPVGDQISVAVGNFGSPYAILAIPIAAARITTTTTVVTSPTRQTTTTTTAPSFS